VWLPARLKAVVLCPTWAQKCDQDRQDRLFHQFSDHDTLSTAILVLVKTPLDEGVIEIQILDFFSPNCALVRAAIRTELGSGPDQAADCGEVAG